MCPVSFVKLLYKLLQTYRTLSYGAKTAFYFSPKTF